MAESFNSHGILRLHGIPIQNAGVDGIYPDAYVHWPPLDAVLLSFITRLFGNSETVVFAYGSTMALAFAGAWFWLIDYVGGRVRAISYTFALLTLEIFIDRSHIWTVSLCYALIVISLRIVLAEWEHRTHTKRAIFVACCVLAFAVLASWEALLMPPGLFVAALLLRDKRLARYSLILGTIVVMAGAAFLLTAFAYVPELRSELVETIKYRAGFGFAVRPTLNTLANSVSSEFQPNVIQISFTFLIRTILFIGAIVSAAIHLRHLWLNRVGELMPRQFAVLVSLMFVPVAWFIIFHNHVYIHDYEWLLMAPVAAIGTGELLNVLWTEPNTKWRKLFRVLLPALLLCSLSAHALHMLAPTGLSAVNREMENVHNYAKEIRAATPSTAVVASPYLGMYIAYYANRHIVRGVQDDLQVQFVVRHAEEYPNDPIYVDIPFEKAMDFPCSLAAFDQTRLKYGILLNLRANPKILLAGSSCTLAPHQKYVVP
jgi:4-amino-4-deoxy-L-arabinose transferase-like glycosyltransferase